MVNLDIRRRMGYPPTVGYLSRGIRGNSKTVWGFEWLFECPQISPIYRIPIQLLQDLGISAKLIVCQKSPPLANLLVSAKRPAPDHRMMMGYPSYGRVDISGNP